MPSAKAGVGRARAPRPRRPGDGPAWPPCAACSIWRSTVSRSARASSISTTPQVLEGVGRAGHVVVGEGPQHEDDGVDLADVGQEPVAEALARAGPFDQPADVDELHGGRHDLRGCATSRPAARAGRRAPWPRRRSGPWWRTRRAPPAPPPPVKRVVQRRLAGVGQADEPEPFHPPAEALSSFWPCDPAARPSTASCTCSTAARPRRRRSQAFRKAAQVVEPSWPRASSQPRVADGTLTELPGIGKSHRRGDRPRRSRARCPTLPRQARGRDRGPDQRGRPPLSGGAARATATPHRLVRRRRADRGDGPHRQGRSATSTWCVTDHSPRLTVAHGLQPRAPAAAARRDRAAQRASWRRSAS